MSDLAAVGALGVALVVFLWIDLKLFARGREPSFKEGLLWSIGWLVVSLLAGAGGLGHRGAARMPSSTRRCT